MPRDPIKRTNYDRIELGMTRSEAEGVLGLHANSADESRMSPVLTDLVIPEAIAEQGQFWSTGVLRLRHDDGRVFDDYPGMFSSYRRSILIAYDQDSRVIGKRFLRIPHGDWWDMLTGYLGL